MVMGTMSSMMPNNIYYYAWARLPLKATFLY